MSYPDRTPSDEHSDKSVKLTEKDIREAARLFQLLSDAGEPLSDPALPPPANGQFTRDELVVRARIVLNSRRLRWRHFPREIFGEPAWDILLSLYITDVSGDRQTIGKLADRMNAPPSTVVRWVRHLERLGLVDREPHPTDRRVAFISLLDETRKAIDAYLDEIPG